MPSLLATGIACAAALMGLGVDSTVDAQGMTLANSSRGPRLTRLIDATRLVNFDRLRHPLHADGTTPLERARTLGLGTARAGAALLTGRPDRRWVDAADALTHRSETLQWPVAAGWHSRGYGSGAGGYHLAIDMMAPVGSDVRAVADGIVGYSDDKIRGYGNIVMLVHAGGAVTAYAHNAMNHVVAGQLVRRGELIARVGSTGISRGPHVHFEFMADGKNCDAAPLFEAGVPQRDGRLLDVRAKTWSGDTSRPPVRCQPRKRHPQSRYSQRNQLDDHDHES